MYSLVKLSDGRWYWVLVPQATPPSPLALALVEGLKIVGRAFWHQITEEARTIRRGDKPADIVMKRMALPFFEAVGRELDRC